MKYLKKPARSDQFNIRIQIKDSNGVVTETMVENCGQFTIDEIMLAIEPYPNSYSATPENVIHESECVD